MSDCAAIRRTSPGVKPQAPHLGAESCGLKHVRCLWECARPLPSSTRPQPLHLWRFSSRSLSRVARRFPLLPISLLRAHGLRPRCTFSLSSGRPRFRVRSARSGLRSLSSVDPSRCPSFGFGMCGSPLVRLTPNISFESRRSASAAQLRR